MKNKLIICPILFLLISLISYAYAESVNYQQALEIIQTTGAFVTELVDENTDVEAKEILQFCQYQLSLSELGLSLVTSVNEEITDYNWFADESELSIATDMRYSAQPTFIEELGYGQAYDVYKQGEYVRIDSYIYTKDLQIMLEHTRIENAKRLDSGEMMILLTQIRNEDLLTSSNRYLVYSNDSTVQSLFRRTFGVDTEYRIDLALWVEGQNYEWDEKLLYPKK